MSYRTGNVAVAQGSKVVTGTGTLWSIAVTPGDEFVICDANLLPIGPRYEVASVDSNTKLTLVQTYQGTTASGLPYAVLNIVGNMTVPSFAQKLARHYSDFQALIDQPNGTPTPASIPVADGTGKIATGWVKDATTSEKGVVELATVSEAQAGTDATRAVTPAGALAAMRRYGLGALQIDGLTVDYDTLKTSGQYVQGPTAPNAPPISSYCFVLVITHLSTYVVQQVLSIDATRGFQRCCHNGIWGNWYDIPIGSAPRANTLAVSSTDNATSTTTASLKTAGGLAVAKDARIGGDLYSKAAELRGRNFSFSDIGGECIADTEIPIKSGGGVFKVVVRGNINPGGSYAYGNFQVGYIHTKNFYEGGALKRGVFFTGDKVGFDDGNATNTADFTVVPMIKTTAGTRASTVSGSVQFLTGDTLSIKLDGVTGAGVTAGGTFVEVTMISSYA
nr:hypothetical protein [uncultured Dethiosulfovibrio sp.]